METARPIVTFTELQRDRPHWVLRWFTCCYDEEVLSRHQLSERLDTEKVNVNTGFRNAFNSSFYFRQEGATNDSAHSHVKAAQDRRVAESSIRSFIIERGLTPYSVSPSQRDNSAGIDCERLYYSPKDIDQPMKVSVLTDRHVIFMIDVDYYTDLNYWLLKGVPTIVYTFVPTQVGGSCVDGCYRFNNGELHVVYNGGATYVHKLWDYALDHFVMDDPLTGWSLMIKVDQVVSPNDPNRRVICLTPTTWYPSDYNGLLFLDTPRLRRLTVQYGDVNLLVYQRLENAGTPSEETVPYVSAAFVDSPTSVTLRYDMFVGVCKRLSLDKKPSVSVVERYLNADKVAKAGILAPIIYDAFVNGWYETKYKHLKKVVHAGQARVAPHYQAVGPLLNEEGEDIGVVVEQPVLTGAAVFPRQSFNNDTAAVVGRVENIRNHKIPNKFIQNCKDEFITAFPCGVAHPVSESDVAEHQDKPMQKARYEQSKHWLKDNFVVKAFMKKESYPKVGDPRNISSVPPAHTTQLSRYTYGAKEVLKKYDWYVPGKTPMEIANLMRDFVADTTEVLETDYSRMDGTISEFLRSVELGVYLRLYPLEHHAEIIRLITSEYNCKATTATGRPYNPGFSRLSGSPLTTDGNTLINAFVVYVAARRSKMLHPKEIEKIPGLAYGDDGIVKGIKIVDLVKSAKQVGMTLKCDQKVRGEYGVTFLSRVFVDPWTTTTSIQAPKRALGKLHLSTVKHVDKSIAAVNRARGYYVSDKLTPLISDWCEYVISKYPDITDEVCRKHNLLDDRNWWSVMYEETESWPQSDDDHTLMVEIVAHDLELTPEEVLAKVEEIKTGTWEPIHYELPISIEAVVTDEHGTMIAGTPSVQSTQ